MSSIYMEQYRNLQQFKSIKEFDQYRSQLFYTIKDKLSKGILKVWNVLSQRSIEIPGVCWVQIDTIAKDAEVSRSTVERAIRLFKKLGVIAVKETTRPKSGGDGANVYVFQKLGEGAEMKGRKSPKKPCPTTDESLNSKNETKTFLDLKYNINHLNTKRSPYIKFVPKSLQHFQALFGKQVKDLYGRVWLAAKKLGVTIDQDVMQEIGFIALNQIKKYVKVDGKQLNKEQMCKIAYKIALNQLEERLEREILDWNHVSDCYFKMIGRKH